MKMNQFRTICNFRDLGGYTTLDNKTIREGYFYRSGGLYLLNEEEKEAFKQLNIKTIVELRTKSEWEAKPDPVFENINYLYGDGKEFRYGKDIDFSPDGMMQMDEAAEIQFNKLVKYDTNIALDNDVMRLLFQAIKNDDVPLLFHCFSGKDRTGVAAMLVLALLNVSKETIIKDYVLSNEYCKQDLDKYLNECPIDLIQHPETKRLVQMTWGVYPKIIEYCYDTIIEKYQTFENYFIYEHQYTMDDIYRIRNKYTY